MKHAFSAPGSKWSVWLAFACLMFALFLPISARAQTLATIVNPANGATNVDPGAPFTWNPVSGAQGYYVWVGTSKGTKNVYQSGALGTNVTSVSPQGLQTNATYYLRLWTEINGCWCVNDSIDTTFTTGYGTAHLTNPANAATNADPYAPFTWNAVPTAQSYTLNIGTVAGGKNVFTSGAILNTSVNVPNLLAQTTYYATLMTQFSTGTLSAASSFTTGAGLAHLKVPIDGAVNVAPGSVFTWNSVSDAQVYDLYIGSTVGAQDVWVSNTTTSTSTTPQGLVANKLYYARMWTEKAGSWFHVDTTFTTGSGTAQLTNPTNGAANVDPYAPFTWTTIANAQSYTIWIGSSIGASDVYNSGPVSATSLNIPGLAQNTAYHARLFTNTSAGSSFVDTAFATGFGMAHLINPAANAANVDPFQPFTWNSVPGAQAYFIYVGTQPGASDIYYSQTIPSSSTSRQVPGLLGAQTYYVKMWTNVNGGWVSINTVFSTAAQALPPDPNAFRNGVQQQTGNVRLMTQGFTNTPIAGTLLAQIVAQDGRTTAFCTEYAETLIQLLFGQRVTSRIRNLSFDANETHVTVEYYDPFLTKWIVADPTFGLVYWNPSTLTGLSVSDLSASIVGQNWTGIQPYVTFTTNNGEVYAHNYYMDPVLLYLNPLPVTTGTVQLPLPNSPAGYFTLHSVSDVGKAAVWVFNFANQSDSAMFGLPGGSTVRVSPAAGVNYSAIIGLPAGWTIVSAPSGMQMLTINRYIYP